MDPKVQTVLVFMEANFHLQISANELARLANVSRSRLYRRFQTEVGEPPIQYLKALRMEKAREYLETSLLSVKEIAAKVGYKYHNHFMREFKKTCGVTPSQYRSQRLRQARSRG